MLRENVPTTMAVAFAGEQPANAAALPLPPAQAAQDAPLASSPSSSAALGAPAPAIAPASAQERFGKRKRRSSKYAEQSSSHRHKQAVRIKELVLESCDTLEEANALLSAVQKKVEKDRTSMWTERENANKRRQNFEPKLK